MDCTVTGVAFPKTHFTLAGMMGCRGRSIDDRCLDQRRFVIDMPWGRGFRADALPIRMSTCRPVSGHHFWAPKQRATKRTPDKF
jgi:hypothetical protein